MNRKFKIIMILGGLGLSVSLFAGPQKPRPQETFKVWMARHPLFKHPASYAKRLAKLPKGTVVKIQKKRGRLWAHVEVVGKKDLQGKIAGLKGWMVLSRPKKRAGQVASGLGPNAEPSSMALAMKGVVQESEDMNRKSTQKGSSIEKAYQALVEASLEPGEVEEFAKFGGLQILKGGQR